MDGMDVEMGGRGGKVGGEGEGCMWLVLKDLE